MPMLQVGNPYGSNLATARLLPNLDQPSSLNGVEIAQDPADFLASNPRVDASITLTLGGTVTTADTITVTVSNKTLPNGSVAVQIAAAGGDTVAKLAAKLAAALCAQTDLRNRGWYATTDGVSVVTLYGPGLVANSTTVTKALSGGATETVTVGNSGAMAGGSGPVIPYADIEYTFNGALLEFPNGYPVPMGSDLVSSMVAAAQPIY